MSNRIIIGTAQFGYDYGIRNRSGRTNDFDFKKIIELAQKKKFIYLDTSKEYGDSEKRIGSLKKSPKWKIITKINLKNIYNNNLEKLLHNFVDQLSDSKKKMNVKKIHGLLLHNVDFMNSVNGENIYKALKQLKKNNLINKFGYSIYNFNNLKKICRIFKPDIIQCPLNIFDRRLLQRGNLTYLNKQKIEIHVRSIFLQGLLLFDKTPKKFKKWNNLFKKWKDWTNLKKISKFNACLNFVMNVKGVNKVLIGVDNFKHFTDITEFKSKKKIQFPQYLNSNDKKLINPSLW